MFELKYECEYDGQSKTIVHRIKIEDEEEPKNNDGREFCFWCVGVKTKKRGGGAYDVCPECER